MFCNVSVSNAQKGLLPKLEDSFRAIQSARACIEIGDMQLQGFSEALN